MSSCKAYASTQEVVQVKILHTDIIKNFDKLRLKLSMYALDKGPVQNSHQKLGETSFRFMVFDWKRTLEKIFKGYRIPYTVTHYFNTNVITYISKRKVYIVEDDPDIAIAMNIILEGAGYDVQLFASGKPMLEERHEHADLFILDKRMPDIDGLALCRQLRSQVGTQHTPVIMISAYRNFASQAFQAGVNDYLPKPFQMNDLLRLVDKHMEQPSLHSVEGPRDN
jgi:two-component system cell cycle response regulator DivK